MFMGILWKHLKGKYFFFPYRWVHIVCALYVPGVAFGDIDKLRPVTLTEMNYSKYGAKVRENNFDIVWKSKFLLLNLHFLNDKIVEHRNTY